MTTNLSIVMPVYNEGRNILSTLDSLYQQIKTPFNLYIVYDFPRDSTLPVITKNKIKYTNLFLIKNDYSRGALNAIKTGFTHSKTKAILVTMADGSDDYSMVDRMYKLIDSGYEVVCPSRYIPGGQQIGGSLLKKYLSRLAGRSLAIITKIPTHDISNNYKMYSKKLLDDIAIESTGGFEIGMEITVKAFLLNYKITELPTVWKDRSYGQSNFKLFKWLPRYLKWYWLAIFQSRLKLPSSK